jgi:transporter family protein
MKISPFVFALATMICWGSAPLFGKAAMLRIDPWMGLAMRSFIIGLAMVIWVLVTGNTSQLLHVKSSTWGLIFSEAVLASLLGHVAYFYAIKYGMLSRVIPIASAFPLVALLGGMVFFSERIGWERLIGVLMVILGVILIRR